jgi:hypothetical protein
MWNKLVNIVKRCLRTAFGNPVAKRETRVQNPPETAEYDEQLAMEYAHKLISEFLQIFQEWKAGTLDIQKYPMLRKPMPRARTKQPKPQRACARPHSVRKRQPLAAPKSAAKPAQRAPIPPKHLRPLPLDSPNFFSKTPPEVAALHPFYYEIKTKMDKSFFGSFFSGPVWN